MSAARPYELDMPMHALEDIEGIAGTGGVGGKDGARVASQQYMSEETHDRPDPPLTFAEHKEITATDLELVAAEFTKAAKEARDGNMGAVEALLLGDEDSREDTAKIVSLRELLVLRYFHRQERIAQVRTKETT